MTYKEYNVQVRRSRSSLSGSMTRGTGSTRRLRGNRSSERVKPESSPDPGYVERRNWRSPLPGNAERVLSAPVRRVLSGPESCRVLSGPESCRARSTRGGVRREVARRSGVVWDVARTATIIVLVGSGLWQSSDSIVRRRSLRVHGK